MKQAAIWTERNGPYGSSLIMQVKQPFCLQHPTVFEDQQLLGEQ